MQDVNYNFSGQQYSQNQNITLDENCNGITVINNGATAAFLNEIPLNAGVPGTNNGESLTIGGNKGEVLKGRVSIRFAAGVGSSVIVIQKFYINHC